MCCAAACPTGCLLESPVRACDSAVREVQQRLRRGNESLRKDGSPADAKKTLSKVPSGSGRFCHSTEGTPWQSDGASAEAHAVSTWRGERSTTSLSCICKSAAQGGFRAIQGGSTPRPTADLSTSSIRAVPLGGIPTHPTN
ncbi:hypothetical protein LX36DRAFT_79262 [Colletotrichum falcatum]|nr:hypothetical protein LX36DRAFT_79262 [Colletotrichum falcatum]